MRYFGLAFRQPDAGHACIHLMSPALKHAQHGFAVLLIHRLAEHLAIQHDNGVAADNNGIPLSGGRQNSFCFA
ncbi:hypothetical protein D3C75_1109580 [compost metagenome]